ncbi:hypothetical protein RHSIM_Rhsim02G0157800 [Rhododendron simsii]|uniref:Uncharacterized protein n=1 Tax=Rhododendron simsii TaxID=118357 RepID=A0A834LVN5_RHOSS|nr:hypothetical protein RHSIM_Rhsim02G0157800 [Rhododendron simsii]
MFGLPKGSSTKFRLQDVHSNGPVLDDVLLSDPGVNFDDYPISYWLVNLALSFRKVHDMTVQVFSVKKVFLAEKLWVLHLPSLLRRMISDAIENEKVVSKSIKIYNVDRAVCGRIAGVVAKNSNELLGLLLMNAKTGSSKGSSILKEWDRYLPPFWQFVPPSEEDTTEACSEFEKTAPGQVSFQSA